MTAIAETAPRGRLFNVVRMQFINRMTFVWIPLLILGAVFVFSMVIWLMIPYGGPKYSAGAQALIWYLLAVGIQSLTLTFPFSQAMSVTRREFFLGTYLAAALTAALLAAVTTIGGLIESATGGWGVNGWMFYTEWTWAAGPLGAALSVFALAMLTFTAGLWGATVYKRFGGFGLTLALVGIGALLLVGMWIIGQFNAWVAVFTWLAALGVVPLSLIVLGIVVVLAASEFWMLRRLVP
jgi:hypothetical protein